MSLKKFDLAKNLGLKVAGRMKSAGVPDRFAQGAGEVLDKRERRARDAAAGLVPFACKLPGELAKQVQERALAHEGGLNGLMAELLATALAPAEAAQKPAPAVKKAPAKKAPADEASATNAPDKKAPAKKAPAKKAAAGKAGQP